MISSDEVLTFLKKRTGILDGVCISGGEPTPDPGLRPLIRQIKSLGYAVKLDTNGSHPDVVKSLAEEGLLDMVAMDIKSSKGNYGLVSGLPHVDTDAVSETVDFLLHGDLTYEFRTTVVKELHTEDDFISIGNWINGADAYYLQAYKDSDAVLNRSFTSYTYKELQEFQKLLQSKIKTVGIRGISD